MLAYRKVFLVILICSALLIVAGISLGFFNIWMLLGLLILNIAMLLAGSFSICSGLYIKAYCTGNTAKKQITFTFDDGPHPEFTPLVLDFLKTHKIKATFFLIGKNIEGNEALLLRMKNEGHIIGNHSFSHVNHFGFKGTNAVTEDLDKSAQIIERSIGKKPILFRPPFGVTNPNIARAARILQYTVVGWSIRSLDTLGKPADKTINRVSKRLKPGSVILFHDNHERIIPILEGIMKKVEGEGYEVMALEELLNIKI